MRCVVVQFWHVAYSEQSRTHVLKRTNQAALDGTMLGWHVVSRERLDGCSMWHVACKVSPGGFFIVARCVTGLESPHPRHEPWWVLAETNLEWSLQSPLLLPAFIRTPFSGAFRGGSQLLLPAFDTTKRNLILFFKFFVICSALGSFSHLIIVCNC